MTNIEEISGIEFDWFAVDETGRIALLATAGAGVVPEPILASHHKYNEISDEFETPHWGSEQVWDDYAQLGLYVYDWHLHGGPYLLKRSPTSEMTELLKNKILALPSLPRLNLNFQNAIEVTERDISNAT